MQNVASKGHAMIISLSDHFVCICVTFHEKWQAGRRSRRQTTIIARVIAMF
jgi:hypothetical protein